MAWIERRERTSASGPARLTYRVRWREPDGRLRAKTFRRKVDADRYAATVSADLVRGHYIAPDAGKVLFRDYAQQWLAAQTFDEGTYEAVELRLRLHALPTLGSRPIKDIQPSTVQGWLRGIAHLAGTYQKVIFANVSTIFTAAVDDDLIAKNPCKAASVRRPRADPTKTTPWTAQRVRDVQAELPAIYALVIDLGAGLGLRQGEIFGLALEDLDMVKGEVEVRRQVKLHGGNKQIFGLPKGRKTRRVPLPDVVLDALSRHMTKRPPREVTLPWDRTDGTPRTFSLLLSTRESTALNRNYFNTHVWKKALQRAGVAPTRDNGCHALRHFYASTLLDAGESIKALSEFLGHADPGFTLKTYTHLMPNSTERTKQAIDAALCVPSAPQDETSAAFPQVSALRGQFYDI